MNVFETIIWQLNYCQVVNKDSFKLDLVKFNFLIFGAGISAIEVGINYSNPHLTVGLGILGATVFMQYLSFLPEFSMISLSDSEEEINSQMKSLDEWYIILASVAYLFLMFSFVIPYGFPDSLIGAALPVLFGVSIFAVRVMLVSNHPSKELTKMDAIVVFSFF